MPLITQQQFESRCRDTNLANIADINSATTGESRLFPLSSNEGAGLTSSEKDEVIAYMDAKDFDSVYNSNSEMGWVNGGKAEPC